MSGANRAPRLAGAALAEYLTQILATNDPALLAGALGVLAREHGMREVARAAGMSREALYKALRPDAQPRFATINKVCRALGIKLVARPGGSNP
jgi:probable addiction module antidote protein